MTGDSINDEILRIKRELAAQFDNDLERIITDTKSRERNSVTLPPRRLNSELSLIQQPPSGPIAGNPSAPSIR
jgi:hypothetical protein